MGARHVEVAGAGLSRAGQSYRLRKHYKSFSGQGAGVAAAILFRTDQPFDGLDVGQVQAELKRQGVPIH